VAKTQTPQATVAVTAFGADSAERTAREMVLSFDIFLISQCVVRRAPWWPAAMAASVTGRMTKL
jgi:hypothetical protein